jgi:hypothetical protein
MEMDGKVFFRKLGCWRWFLLAWAHAIWENRLAYHVLVAHGCPPHTYSPSSIFKYCLFHNLPQDLHEIAIAAEKRAD